MLSKRISFCAIIVLLGSYLKFTTALTDASEAGRVVMKNFKKVVYPTTEFAYTAMIEQNRKFKCGAVIISRGAVLTAAHCVKGVPSKTLKVRTGTFTKLDETGSYVQAVKVDRKFFPDGYTLARKENNDIAVVKLKSLLIFNENVRAARLPYENSRGSYKKSDVLALGYGNLGNGETQTLKKAHYKLMSKAQCQGEDKSLTNAMLCAKPSGGIGETESGDSGSPLIANHNPSSPQNDVVVGIASFKAWSYKQGQQTVLASVYTNVALFHDWIESKI